MYRSDFYNKEVKMFIVRNNYKDLEVTMKSALLKPKNCKGNLQNVFSHKIKKKLMTPDVFAEELTVLTNAKEKLLKQKGIVIWMVGLSGAGKSTLAKLLEKQLHDSGILTQLLDGDNLRMGINSNLGFSVDDRIENLRRAAEIAKLFKNCGIVTICSFISPTYQSRTIVKEIIGDDFYEVYISCSLDECERRDTKGLYNKARKGGIENFTGISSPFEEPASPFIKVETDVNSINECLNKLTIAFKNKINVF
jgi:adenylylsulfate kinase